MKIVYSFYTKCHVGDRANFTGGWPSMRHHMCSWAFSMRQSLKLYGNSHLVTDEWGASLLIDDLKLPFTTVDKSLESVVARPWNWTIGKLMAYRMQDEPFMHLDADVFLWKRLPKPVEHGRVIAQVLEEGVKFNFTRLYSACREMEERLAYTPPSWKDVVPTGYNLGICGGHDLKAIHEYADQALRTYQDEANVAGWDLLEKGSRSSHWWWNCIVEQLTFYSYMTANQVPVAPVFTPESYSDRQARRLGYTHAMGGKRGKPGEGGFPDLLYQNLTKDYPDDMKRISALYGNG